MDKGIFTWFELPETRRGKHTKQILYNEYFFYMMKNINQHMVEFNETFEWKEKKIKQLVEMVGYPVKLTRWQRVLAYLTF